MKKLLILIIVTLLSIVSFAEPVEIDGICYNLISKTKKAIVTKKNGSSSYNGSVVIPDIVVYDGIEYNVKEIDKYAFFCAMRLYSVTIPESVTTIGESAFCGSSLVSVNIPNSVTYIEESVFQSCVSLNSLIIPNSVTHIGRCAFYHCGLSSINIPNSVQSISDWAFRDCQSLTSIIISNSVTSIGEQAFAVCSRLTSITIGNGVQSIGSKAFSSCPELQDVYCYAEKVPSTVSNAFEGSYIEYATLHVRESSLDVYSSSEPWMNFKEFVKLDIPKYSLIYLIDDEEYKSYEIEEGLSITKEPIPTKEGYTFSGWSEIPETMPAHDVTVTGTFTVNKYKLTYKVDGEEYKSSEVEYGVSITAEAEPTKEGYTFSGWSEIPETMPAKDVVITGTFTVNKYKLTYKVDGEEYKSSEVEYGATITAEAEPTKEGYTFSGWSEIPETMPAHDVTVTGTFTVNKYKLTYMVDGEEYKTFEVGYGTAITAEEEPTKEGYTFSGWSEIPETMPAHDVTITGMFTVNKYTITYMIDDEVFKTESVEYGSAITPPEAPVREGYMFEWIDVPETMPAKDITIEGSYTLGIGSVYIEDVDVKWYTLDGKRKEGPQKGLNIMKNSNGKTKKVVVK